MKKGLKAALTCLSCVGTMGVGVLAVRDTLKHIDEKISFKDYVKRYWKDYIPTAAVCVATTTSIITNHILTTKDIKALGAFAAGSTALLADYKEAIKKEFGQEGLETVVRDVAKKREQIAKDVYIGSSGLISTLEDINEAGDTLFYDEFSDTWFRTSLYNVKNAMYHFNRNFSLTGCVAIEEFYEFLGIEPEMKWPKGTYGFGNNLLEDGIYWIDFEIVECETNSGEKYYTIYFEWQPGEYDEDESTYYI